MRAISPITPPAGKRPLRCRIFDPFRETPLLAWLFGAGLAVLLEHLLGESFAALVGLAKVPVLFGLMIILSKPLLFPGALLYVAVIYLLPLVTVALLLARPANTAAAALLRLGPAVSVLFHLALFYAVLHFWAEISGYREMTVKFTLIAVLLTLSLNLINGYMGEFSCSHPGFMALGAYGASIFSLSLFVNDPLFGKALLPAFLGPWLFPLGLVGGGLLAALGALLIAIPSFKTRGDYLAIISLAFLFIVKSLLENLPFVGGPRGMGSQPDYASLPVVFAWTAMGVWIMNNYVRSTLGRSLNAIRDDEAAAEAMSVNTRHTKMTAFMFAAFWAGVAGGLFAHMMRFINPATFGVQRLAEMLAMVYFGGLNSVYGSIVGAVSLNLLGEVLRPLELFKWIFIPLLLILVMIFRPTGLLAFRDFDAVRLVQPRSRDRQGGAP
ncbi:MAG: branched-chain amino acid ABC transporter permease [Desulfobulbus sp.]|jgi:branched-chain amino acid transport system permease protein|nr:MAG: branched-chain amino acid ABC transporter permease [Desulfobulbus sp.]